MNKIKCKQCGRIHQFSGKDCFYDTLCWRKLRLAQLELDGTFCRLCGKPGQCVHHTQEAYKRGFGNEIVGKDLVTLCNECHEGVTNFQRQARFDARPLVVEEYVSRATECPFLPAKIVDLMPESHKGNFKNG